MQWNKQVLSIGIIQVPPDIWFVTYNVSDAWYNEKTSPEIRILSSWWELAYMISMIVPSSQILEFNGGVWWNFL